MILVDEKQKPFFLLPLTTANKTLNEQKIAIFAQVKGIKTLENQLKEKPENLIKREANRIEII